MAIFCGVDIVEIERLKKSINGLESFRDRVFTKGEIDYCEKRNRAKYESYAARFAAKEAVLKAFGTGMADGLDWRQVEILNNDKGKPYVVLSGNARKKFDIIGGKSIDISLSHCEEFAIAFTVIET
ncbi:MAG: holo-ACP synthase [Acetivibrionales bacterium]|jgi:holo-[acyl-carrier protein] synthase